MSYLLANGCSFTNKNYSTHSHGFAHSIEEKKQLGIPLEDWPMWPEYAADKLELLHSNIAKSGRSNEFICNTTIEESEIMKPKVIMILWSSSWRENFLGHNYNHRDYVMAIQIANNLLKQCEEISVWKNLLRKDVGLGFKLLNYYYPDSYDRCIKFYSKKSSEIESMHTFEYVMKVRDKWDIHPVLSFTNHYLDLYYMGSSIREQMRIISNELRPLLNLYEYCKSENIPVVTKCLLHFGGFPSIKLGKKKLREIRKLNKNHLTIFDKMLLGLEKMCKSTDKAWTDNYYFKKLDDLVADKKYIIENWPCHPALQSKTNPGHFVPDWKKISDKDSHPHWDTQKIIGDVFYDLYKKNYS